MIQSFADDFLNLKPFADKLTKVVSNLYLYADGAYVLSLNGSFGAGKSTFLNMWGQTFKKMGITLLISMRGKVILEKSQ